MAALCYADKSVTDRTDNVSEVAQALGAIIERAIVVPLRCPILPTSFMAQTMVASLKAPPSSCGISAWLAGVESASDPS